MSRLCMSIEQVIICIYIYACMLREDQIFFFLSCVLTKTQSRLLIFKWFLVVIKNNVQKNTDVYIENLYVNMRVGRNKVTKIEWAVNIGRWGRSRKFMRRESLDLIRKEWMHKVITIKLHGATPAIWLLMDYNLKLKMPPCERFKISEKGILPRNLIRCTYIFIDTHQCMYNIHKVIEQNSL